MHCGTPAPGQDASGDSPTLTAQGKEIYERLTSATAGKYDVVREVGRGGMAVVFLGYQRSLDRHVALKVLLPLLGYDPEIVERFKREARTQGKLEHPNIISVYEVYDEGGLTFFAMPYITGESLRKELLERPKQSIDTTLRYTCQAADALAYAHRRGVVHRDVKPDNILLDKERDRVVLTDFGIAKALSAETTLTTPGDLLGTPQYMSPEQGEGKADLDGRADQYALGLIAYEMLAGQRPLQADNLAELMYKHRFEEPEPLRNLRPDVPSNIVEAVTRAIQKDRDDRYPTMDAFLAALESPVGGVPVEDRRLDESDPGTTVLLTPYGLESGKRRRTPTRPPRKGVVPPEAEPEPDWEAKTQPSMRRAPTSQPEAAVRDPTLSTTVTVGDVSRKEPKRSGIPRVAVVGGIGAAAALVLAMGLLMSPVGEPPIEADGNDGASADELIAGDAGGGDGSDPTSPPADESVALGANGSPAASPASG